MKLSSQIGFLVLAMIATGAGHAGTIRVNATDWSNSRDGNLNLREAALVGGGQLVCMTQAERNQVSGCNFIVTLPSPSCSYNPLNETRWQLDEINANCGAQHSDDIVFDAGAANIAPGGPLELWMNDNLDGGLPGGALVRLTGPGPAGWAGPAIKLADAPVTTSALIRNLQISGFNGDGIFLRDTSGARFEGLEIFNNAGHGIALGPSPFGVARISSTRIGTADGSSPNYIHGNGGFGIRFVDEDTDGGNRLNTIQSTFVGLKPGNSAIDAGNALGGIEWTKVPGSRIGGSSAASRVFIAWNDGPGLRLNGDSKFNTIAGVTIGLTPAGAAAPNQYGIELANGPHDNAIGVNGSARNVISGNANHGIRIFGNSDSNLVEANYIGLTEDLGTVRPNGQDGITILSDSSSNNIRRNVISGNLGWGVWTQSAPGNQFVENAIGVRGLGSTATEVVPTPNSLGGIALNQSDSNIVGPGNVIAANGGVGLRVQDGDANGLAVRGNRIGLDGAGNDAGNAGDGIQVSGGADNIDIGSLSVADRNLIGGNDGDGIDVDGASTDIQVVGNRIGTDPNGSAARPNTGNGVYLRNGVDFSVVRGNLLSGNGNDGLKLESGTDHVDVLANIIGLNAARTGVLGNTASGVAIVGGAPDNRIGDGTGANQNTIAGNNTGVFISGNGSTGNVVDNNLIGYEGTVGLPLQIGNTADGVFIGGGADNTVVANNSILRSGDVGIDLTIADGTVIRGNRIGIGFVPTAGAAHPNGRGIRLTGGASGTQIGGANPATDRNVVSHNTLYGIGLFNAGTTGNTILNNWIGVSLAGAGDAGNNTEGVLVQEQSTNNSITLNVVSGNNGDGIRVRHAGTTGNNIQRNLVGTDSAGTGQVPNGGAGVRIDSDASGNNIGFLPGQGNTIRFNNGDGIWIESGSDNAISLNTIDTNVGLGIDLGANGVQANDAGDGDAGANNLQNHPVISGVSRGGGMISFTATLQSTASRTYGLQFWRNLTCDPSGHGEGEVVLGDGQVTVGAGGTGNVVLMMPLADNAPATWLTGVAIDGDNTSEFSSCAAVGVLGDAVFANGFENSSVAASTSKELPAQDGFEVNRLDASRVHVRAALSRPLSGPGRPETWLFGSSGPVAIESISALGADCRVAGSIRCSLAGNGDVVVDIVLAAPEGRFVAVTRERSGWPGREFRHAPP